MNTSVGIELWPVLITSMLLVLAGRATAQTFTTFYSFTPTQTNLLGDFTNNDGAYPLAGLSFSGGTLYGTTGGGGCFGNGTVFRINTDGSGFATLHNFSQVSTNSLSVYTNNDGARPAAGLVVSGSRLYGTAVNGGISGSGTVFKLETDGTAFSTLYNFSQLTYYPLTGGSNTDGASPQGSLVLIGQTLYGTAAGGGTWNGGTAFSISTDGSAFTLLHDFIYGPTFLLWVDGHIPSSGLTLVGDTLYGTTSAGGYGGNPWPWPYGTAFSLNTDGTLRTLFTFLLQRCLFPPCPNYAGQVPLYGATYEGGVSDSGVVYSLAIDGTGFTTVHTFSALNSQNGGTNSDGANPYDTLTLAGHTLYGTTSKGGSLGYGSVFSVNVDGTGFVNLHSFSGTSDGANPQAGLTLTGNALYGTTVGGGQNKRGTIFRIVLAPELTIAEEGESIILKWPTGFSGFSLQSASNISAPIWTTNVPAPVIVDGQFTVSCSVSDSQQFFRLSQP